MAANRLETEDTPLFLGSPDLVSSALPTILRLCPTLKTICKSCALQAKPGDKNDDDDDDAPKAKKPKKMEKREDEGGFFQMEKKENSFVYIQVYGNFALFWDHFSRISQLSPPRTRRVICPA